MTELIRMEFKKIYRKRMNIFVTLCCFFATVLFFSLPFIQYRAWNENGIMLTKDEAVSYKKKCYNALAGTLTEERIARDIEEYQMIASDPDHLITERGGEVSFTDEIYFGYLAPRQSYLNMIGNTYIYNGMGAVNIPGIAPDDISGFYEARNETVKQRIADNTYLNETEQQYWLKKSLSISSPYEYGYVLGWANFGDTAGMLMICMLGICIAIAPVFAGEYQTGTDAIILSTRYGKNKTVTAKIIAAILFGTVVFAVNAAAALLIPLMTFGMEGGSLPLQIMDNTCPYDLTFAEAAFMTIAIAFIVMLGLTSLTLLLSAKMKSSYTVLIIDVMIIFVPVFTGTGRTSLSSHILQLLPYQALSGLSQFKQYFSWSFGNIVLNLFSMTVLVYLLLSALALFLASLSFKKHQVQ
ncbi:MAG: ABC transporter permease subunit [Coprococcus sp.]